MENKAKISVVIVDDHPLFRQGLRQAVAGDERFEVIGEADNGTTALELILRLKPTVAMLDVNLPGMNGLEVAEALRTKKSSTHVVILTMLKDEQVFNQTLNLGIKGYVLKENASAEILGCLAAAAADEAYISPSLSEFLLRRRTRSQQLAAGKPGLDNLTVAERRILKRVAAGRTNKEIAAELFISPRTVESHRANICEKLELAGSNKLLQFALEHRDALGQLD